VPLDTYEIHCVKRQLLCIPDCVTGEVIVEVLYPDGKINWINIERKRNEKIIQHGSNLHINELISEKDFYFTEVTILDKKEDIKNNIIVYCGDGGMGGDGFVLVEIKSDTKIKWAAFFENANPFEKVDIDNGEIVTYNNLQEKWIFNLNDPTNLSII
jgi:hypothetical protein